MGVCCADTAELKRGFLKQPFVQPRLMRADTA